MVTKKCVSCLMVVAILPAFAVAQSRDSKAVDLLTRCLATSLSGQVPSDFTVSASLGDGIEMTFTARSITQFRLDKASPSGNEFFISNTGRAWSRSSNSSIKALPMHTSLQVPGPLFLLQLFDSLQNNGTRLSYVGLEESSGASLHHIQIQRSNPSIEKHGLSSLLSSEWYLDTSTSLVSRIEDHVASAQNANDIIQRVISLSNYQSLSGLMMPTVIEESLGGNHLFRFEIKSVAINTGLKDNDFLPNSTSSAESTASR